MPAQTAHALEAMAHRLRPLQKSVARAVPQIETCHSDLARMSWNERLFVGPFFAGLFTAVNCAGMMRCTLGNRVAEAERYELLGRNVEKTIAAYPAEEQRKIHDWINGVPPAEPKKVSRKRR